MPALRYVSGGGAGAGPGTGERAYAYAKACGIIGKSFVGSRTGNLGKAERLSELDRLIFPETFQNLPEKELLHNLEARITARAVASIIRVIKGFSEIPEILILLLRSYEYADLKNLLVSAVNREKSAPPHADLGQFQTLRFKKWPDIKAMIKDSEFEFLLDKKGALIEEPGNIKLEAALDRHYYLAVWKALEALPASDKRVTERIIAEEISLRNSGWALRLRKFYRMKAEEVKQYLLDIPLGGKKGRGKSLASDAIRSLEYPLDNYQPWSSWRWKEFLNPNTGAGFWQADPRHFQNAASKYLYKLARRSFRIRPSSLDAVFCFVKTIQFEEDVLTSGAEGLGMGLSGKEILVMLGLAP